MTRLTIANFDSFPTVEEIKSMEAGEVLDFWTIITANGYEVGLVPEDAMPSRLIEEAWVILEFGLSQGGGHFSTNPTGWECDFDDEDASATDQSACVTICRAFLLGFASVHFCAMAAKESESDESIEAEWRSDSLNTKWEAGERLAIPAWAKLLGARTA